MMLRNDTFVDCEETQESLPFDNELTADSRLLSDSCPSTVTVARKVV